jgi:hypothetical protein
MLELAFFFAAIGVVGIAAGAFAFGHGLGHYRAVRAERRRPINVQVNLVQHETPEVRS